MATDILIIVLIISFVAEGSSFIPCRSTLQSKDCKSVVSFPEFHRVHKIFLARGTSDDDSKSKKNTVARAGGRRPRGDSKRDRKEKNNDIFSVFRQWAIPLVLLVLFLRFIFGIFGSTSNSNIVYYSRSVYQSTTYSEDGNVRTTTKENFQSNMPALVEQYSQQGYRGEDADEDISYIDKEIDVISKLNELTADSLEEY